MRVALGEPDAVQPRRGDPPFPLDPPSAHGNPASPPKPVKLKAFDPATDKLLDTELTVEQGVVRIDKEKLIEAHPEKRREMTREDHDFHDYFMRRFGDEIQKYRSTLWKVRYMPRAHARYRSSSARRVALYRLRL